MLERRRVVINVEVSGKTEKLLRVEAANRKLSKRKLVEEIINEWLYRNRLKGFYDLNLDILTRIKRVKGEESPELNEYTAFIYQFHQDCLSLALAYYQRETEEVNKLYPKVLAGIKKLNSYAEKYMVTPMKEFEDVSLDDLILLCYKFVYEFSDETYLDCYNPTITREMVEAEMEKEFKKMGEVGELLRKVKSEKPGE